MNKELEDIKAKQYLDEKNDLWVVPVNRVEKVLAPPTKEEVLAHLNSLEDIKEQGYASYTKIDEYDKWVYPCRLIKHQFSLVRERGGTEPIITFKTFIDNRYRNPKEMDISHIVQDVGMYVNLEPKDLLIISRFFEGVKDERYLERKE